MKFEIDMNELESLNREFLYHKSYYTKSSYQINFILDQLQKNNIGSSGKHYSVDNIQKRYIELFVTIQRQYSNGK